MPPFILTGWSWLKINVMKLELLSLHQAWTQNKKLYIRFAFIGYCIMTNQNQCSNGPLNLRLGDRRVLYYLDLNQELGVSNS